MRSMQRVPTELNDRRLQLLKAIVEEYVRTAEPVGSKNLVRRYRLKVSPATVRNEMAVLVDAGFLQQPHTSAGRIPAPLGLRYYIYQLMTEDKLPVLEEVAVKQKLADIGQNTARLYRKAVKLLSDKTKLAAVILTEDEFVATSGVVNLLDYPEFYDIDVARAVLSLIDNPLLMHEILSSGSSDDELQILIGDEIELAHFEQVGMVYAPFTTNQVSGYLGVIGPYRMQYPMVIPTLRYLADCLNSA